MTQEEKARAYDTAIKIAKETYDTQPMYRNWLESMFPELAELKDKRIRERIRLCLEECLHSDIIRDYEKDECLAWLEKQGKKSQRMISAEAKEAMYNNLLADKEMKELLRTEYEKGRADAIAEHWKPSKEQMAELLSEVEGWTKGCPKQIVLESLYNDLMKLYGTDR